MATFDPIQYSQWVQDLSRKVTELKNLGMSPVQIEAQINGIIATAPANVAPAALTSALKANIYNQTTPTSTTTTPTTTPKESTGFNTYEYMKNLRSSPTGSTTPNQPTLPQDTYSLYAGSPSSNVRKQMETQMYGSTPTAPTPTAYAPGTAYATGAQANTGAIGQPISGWPNAQNMPSLYPPATQYTARMGPTAYGQYQGYQRYTTGASPEETNFRLWSRTPPSGTYSGLTFMR